MDDNFPLSAKINMVAVETWPGKLSKRMLMKDINQWIDHWCAVAEGFKVEGNGQLSVEINEMIRFRKSIKK